MNPVVLIEKMTRRTIEKYMCGESGSSTEPKQTITQRQTRNFAEFETFLDNVKNTIREDDRLDARIREAELELQSRLAGTTEEPSPSCLLPTCLEGTSKNENLIEINNPGLKLFDLKLRERLFSTEENEKIFQDLPELKTDFDRYLQKQSFQRFKDTVQNLSMLIQNVTCKDFVVRVLFLSMSTCRDHHYVCISKKVLIDILKAYPDLTGIINFELICEVMVNMGANFNLEVFAPLIELPCNDFFAWLTCQMAKAVKENVQDVCEQFPFGNLEAVLSIIDASFACRKEHRHSEISSLVITLSYLSLDVNLRNSPTVTQIGVCLNNMLNKYEDNIWIEEVYKLAFKLTSLTSHHHDSLFVAKLFSYSVRGLHLRRIISFLILHKLFNTSLLRERIDDVTPLMVFTLLSSHSVSNPNDLYMLHSFIWFLDLSINTSICHKYGATMSDLCCALKRIGSGIKESIDCLDPSKIKNVICCLDLKWSHYINLVPLHQKTMFGYLKTESDSVPSSYADEHDPTVLADIPSLDGSQNTVYNDTNAADDSIFSIMNVTTESNNVKNDDFELKTKVATRAEPECSYKGANKCLRL